MDRIVIDLEMCRINQTYYKNRYRYRTEIIQLGAVRIDENFQITDQFSSFVCPQFGKIDHFIRQLTGISERQLRDAPDLENMLILFNEWIGTDEYQIYAWSNTDHAQLQKEILSKKIENPVIGSLMIPERWVDYQQIFKDRFALRNCPSLKAALELAQITHEGRMHDGLDDAWNTARMVAMLEQNPDYQLPVEWPDVKKEPETLTYSLGNLFADALKTIA